MRKHYRCNIFITKLLEKAAIPVAAFSLGLYFFIIPRS